MKKIEKYLDIIVYGLLILMCFFLFSHRDIIYTGNHSMVLLNGNITDFYTACKEFTGSYSANYMPSTFILFAIWNIPLRIIFGGLQSPEGISIIHIYWYKLLPCLFFFLTVLQLRKLCNKLGFTKEKTIFICTVFLTAPLAVYSQFMFFQYDIFTVFFMVAGLNCYFVEDKQARNHIWFCIFFGIAITFKYQALLFFMVLLFFKEKRINKIIMSLVLVCIPILAEISVCLLLDKDSFIKAVLQFGALDKVTASTSGDAFNAINPFIVFICVLLAVSYYMEEQSKDNFICNAFFLCSGVCFGLFGFMAWHPQWLLMGVVFWTVSTCMNKYCDVLLLLDAIGIVVYYMFVCMKFPDNVDQRLLVNGGLFQLLRNKDRGDIMRMEEIYHSDLLGAGFLFSILFAIFLVQFIFVHSRFRQKDIYKQTGSKWVLRTRFLVGVFAFVIPALMCLPEMLKRPDVLYVPKECKAVDYILDFNHSVVTQSIPLKECEVTEVQLFTATFDAEVPNTSLQMDFVDTVNGEVLASSVITSEHILNNGYSVFEFQNCVLSNSQYEIRLQSIANGMEEYTTVYYYVPDSENENKEMLSINERAIMQSSMVMRILGN